MTQSLTLGHNPNQPALMTRNFGKLSLTAFTAVSCLIAGCSNPADDTESAKVNQAMEAVDAVAGAKNYSISPDSTIAFVGSKVTGSHDGGFKRFAGTLSVADGKIVPPSKVTIQMESLWADQERLTNHLKSPDFFDVANIPTAEFAVISMRETADGPEITGNLTLHGVTKSITFNPEITITDSEVSLKAEFDIMRFDFGIVYKGKADDLIRDEVVIKLDVKATAGA